MSRKTIKIFDTTLRDGTQGEKVSFSVDDKLQIALRLDDFGIHYIEGGWPGSNPKDIQFFKKVREKQFKHAKIVAFGSTRYKKYPAEQDPNLNALLEADTPAVSIFGKSWHLHVEAALKITPEENIRLIEESIAYIKSQGKEVIYDAEHFFDGYKDDSDHALQTLFAAERGGADVLVLCDTNGGTSPSEITKIISDVKKKTSAKLGIHTHNDSELAVANTLIAVESGVEHVQGTINGYGERCGNANLCSVIPNLQLKMNCRCIPEENLSKLTALSNFVSEIANLPHQTNLPFVGNSAFAHKGGIHVSAVMKEAETYEHVSPDLLGNRRRVLVSDLSGKSNIIYKADELGIDLEHHQDKIPQIVNKLKDLENTGYVFEAAEASLELLIRQETGKWKDFFDLRGFRILVEKDGDNESRSEATIRLKVGDSTGHIAAEGDGPVHALDVALRKSLFEFYPQIRNMHLLDYKVRILNQKEGTGAKVRVLIDFHANGFTWSTVGVSENIIEASWQALIDGYSYFLFKYKKIKAASKEKKSVM